MKKYNLTLTVKSSINPNGVDEINNIEADDIISLITQFNVMIAFIHRKYYEQELTKLRMSTEDDIPF